MHLRPNLYFHEHTRLNGNSVLRCCIRVSSDGGYFFNGNCNRCARCLFLSYPGRFRNCGASRPNRLGTCTLDPSALAQLAASNVKPCRSMSKAHLGATQFSIYLREHFYEALEPTKGRPHAGWSNCALLVCILRPSWLWPCRNCGRLASLACYLAKPT